VISVDRKEGIKNSMERRVIKTAENKMVIGFWEPNILYIIAIHIIT
jgi:hypothetical protein